MREIFWLVKNSLRVTFKSKKNIIIYILTPVIGLFISFLSYGNATQPALNVGIVDYDHQYVAANTIDFLNDLKNVKISKTNKKAAESKLASGKLDCAIILDSGFSKSVEAGTPEHIQLVSIKGAQVTGFVKSYLYQYLNNVSALSRVAKGNQNAFEKLYFDYKNSSFHLAVNTVKDTTKTKEMTTQSIGFLIMIMLFSAASISEIIIKAKENRTYFRLLTTPISGRQYVFSNVVVNMLVMILQILIVNVSMKKIFHVDPGVSFWKMSGVLMIFALVAVSLSLMIVSFANNSKLAGAIQNLVITPTCLLAGCFWPVEIMPKSIQKVADFLPQRWVMDTIGQLQEGHSLGSLYLNILILFIFSITFFLIAVYKFGQNNNVNTYV